MVRTRQDTGALAARSYNVDGVQNAEVEIKLGEPEAAGDGHTEGAPKRSKKQKTTANAKLDALSGFRPWKTTTTLASGGKLSSVAQYNIVRSKYTQTVEVQHDDTFVIKPLTINEGPLKGRHVLMLEPVPVTDYFRFLDLPPELRQMIYELLVVGDGPIRMTTHKPVGQPRRPVLDSFINYGEHKKYQWDRNTGKYIDQPPSTWAILRVNKQIFNEVAPIAYGANRFEFLASAELKCFLDSIKSMRSYLKHLKIEESYFQVTAARSILYSLRDANALRSLAIPHTWFCQYAGNRYYNRRYTVTVEDFVNLAARRLKAWHKAGKSANNTIDALTVLRVSYSKGTCYECRVIATDGSACRGTGVCEVKCKEHEAHCEKLTEKLRAVVARSLGVRTADGAESEPEQETVEAAGTGSSDF